MPKKPAKRMNEFDAIEKLFAPLSKKIDGAYNLKDDVAFFENSIFTTDTIVEGTHFRGNDPLATVAQKLVRVNLSDIICKGARPKFALLNLTWSKGGSGAQLEDFAKGLKIALEEFSIPLIGGDTVLTNGPLVFSMTMAGQAINESPVLRHCGRIGDEIFVTGHIGCAKIGLESLNDNSKKYEFCRKHYQIPQIPDVRIAEIIAKYATSSLDISDGLIGDCQKLVCADNAIRLDIERMPINSEVSDWLLSREQKLEALIELASFGDDYQCAFTIAPKNREITMQLANEMGINLTRIGEIVAIEEGGLFFGNDKLEMPKRKSYSHSL